MKNGGYFVISLDFELMWGMFDKTSIESYGENIAGVSVAIPELLSLFQKYEIHATWATVGLLMYQDAAALRAALPEEAQRPRYLDPRLSSYEHFFAFVEQHPEYEKYYFAPELVRKIVNTPGQELASHTFSHYYCLDGHENSQAIFSADCHALTAAVKQFGVTPTSIVFPRNQTTPAALAVCSANGLTAYRGTENHWLYQARKESAQSNLFIRGLRLIDHYLNLSGHHTYLITTVNSSNYKILNLPASRFFRPYLPLLRWFESVRLRRIKNAMTHAAKNGEVFHLWWHPHNFGSNRKENFKNLLNLLDHYQELKAEYGMESKNMAELATRARESTDATTSVN